jgi:hypothetical protein
MDEAINPMVNKWCIFVDSMLHAAEDFFQSLISSKTLTVLAATGSPGA